jgi:hypothetical protein
VALLCTAVGTSLFAGARMSSCHTGSIHAGQGAMLETNRHDRGWPRFQLLTWVTVSDQTWRYCIEPMGYRDTVWERSGYVELIRWNTSYRGGTGLELPRG